MLTKLKKMMILLAFIGLSISSATAQTWPPAGMAGDGLTEATAWQITTPAHLEALAAYVNAGNGNNTQNKFYKMMNNINLNGYSNWEPIGNNIPNGVATRFQGTFDGNNKIVQNLTINKPTQQYIGLFGFTSGATIKNLGIAGGNITGGENTGGFVGYAGSTTISSCYSSGYISTTVAAGSTFGAYAGGIAGCGYDVFIIYCYNLGAISASSASSSATYGAYAGGIMGNNGSSTITNCYNTGNISASASASHPSSANSGSFVGGIVGLGSPTSVITDCYNTGVLSSSYTHTGTIPAANAGGIAGSGCSITNCYNTATVSATSTAYSYAGGIRGRVENNGNHITDNCYNTGNVDASSNANFGERIAGAGGITGGSSTSYGAITITNCYNTGNVSASMNSTISSSWADAGGIYGSWRPFNFFENAIINNCYNVGTISATSNAQPANACGIFGWDSGGSTVNNSYYLSGSAPNPGGGVSKSSAEMKLSAFVILLNGGPAPNSAYKLDEYLANNGYPIFTWQGPAPMPPVITTTTLPNGTVGTAYSAQLEADGNLPIEWTKISGDLPAGLTLSLTGLISGTPTAAGTSNFTVKAENSAGSDTKALSITVTTSVISPTITTESLPDGTVSTTYSQQLTATGTAPIEWTLQSGTLPAGLTLSTAGVISGTPTTVGTSNFTVKATNSAGNDTKPLFITIITSTIAPTITTTTLPGGLVGTAYNQQLAATGTTPITWTLQSGALPAGLSLSTAGVISGTPTTAGTSNFTVKATNSAGSDTKALSIAVTTSAVAPTITTSSLPAGTVATTYNAQLEATGTAPITWALQSGNLPAGLSLSTAGKISGTPTAASTSNFTVKATNSAGSATKQLSITVNPAPQLFISGKITLPNQTPLTSGVVELYKKSTYSLSATVSVDNSGKYLFADVAADNYVIRAVPKNTDNHLTITYYGNVEQWYYATAVAVGANSLENINITMIALPEMSGNSAISGTVYEGEGSKKGITSGKGDHPASNIVVYLQIQQPDWKTIAYTTTNENGYYKFGNIPANTYRVILDVPGIPMNDIITIELAEGETVTDINYIISDDGIDPLLGISEMEMNGIWVYPNPTSGELHIGYAICDNAICDIEIYDLMGRRVATVETLRATSLHPTSETTIDVSHLPTGMYFLKIGNKTVKFVKE